MLIPPRHPRSPRHSSWKPRPKVSPQYLAAIIDGEGSIYAGQGTHSVPSIVLEISNSYVAMLETVQSVIGGTLREGNKHSTRAKPAYHLRIYGRTALPTLLMIRPYLLIKHAQCDLAIELLTACSVRPGYKISSTAHYRRIEILNDLKRLNARGQSFLTPPDPVEVPEYVEGRTPGTKTHCPRGHEYTEANTYVFKKKNGLLNRQCRACKQERRREGKAAYESGRTTRAV